MANGKLVLSILGGLAALSFAGKTAFAADPTVWAIDDGEKIKKDAITLPFKAGTDNPVWSPGQPIRLIALRNETVAVQIVVEGADAWLDSVTVDLDKLTGPGGNAIANDPGATDPTKFVGRPIERFVENFFDIAKPSGGKDATESLGWSSGSGPPKGNWTGQMPDALIPVEVAKSWTPYPMQVGPHENGIVWIDITVPPTQAPGTYTGNVVVQVAGHPLATLPLELQIFDVTLPDRPSKTMLFYDRSELDRRIGGGDAVEQNLWQLYHRHRLSAMHSAMRSTEVQSHMSALDGSLFKPASGYDGPGVGLGDGILSLGTYGDYGDPNATKLGYVAQIADLLGTKNLLTSTDVFIYATDEDCSSPLGAAWKTLLAGSVDPNVKSVKVGWTCSQDPSLQPVDIPIILAKFDPVKAAAARKLGKDVWVYNGERPATGAFLTDTPAVDLRVNGWLASQYDIGRWFYWETTFWYDDNNGGHGAYDPFSTAETFHNKDGDWCMGDGVLVYPGKQVDDFTDHSLGMNGIVASIRLKNWRRGIEDGGYYELAHAVDAAKAEAIAKGLLPTVLSSAKSGKPVSWSERGKPFFDARKALLALIPAGSGPGPDGGISIPDGGGSNVDGGGTPTNGDSPPSASDGCGCRSGCGRCSTAVAPFAVASCVFFMRRRRRQRRDQA